MELIDNINKTLKEDLREQIQSGSKISIAASCFSIYAYQALKKELGKIDELRFIFTSPAFTTEKASKEKREYYIPRLNRERTLGGSEFEVKLRNELTQKAIARECADWIRKKVRFRSNRSDKVIQGFIEIEGKESCAYTPVQGFTTADLGCEQGNALCTMIMKADAPFTQQYLLMFNNLWDDREHLEDVTEQVIRNITDVYAENSPEFIYYVTLYNIFRDYLDNVSEDVLPNEDTGFKNSAVWKKLYRFQKDAALGIISKLEQYNGCILADSVGLGKTFTALAVIKYYQSRNKSILVLCPKKLSENWNTYKANYTNNPLREDRLNYDVLFHTDLSRDKGLSNGLNLDRIAWGNYDLVVIDESHNFRNGGKLSGDDERENRYLRLMNKVIRAGVQTKVLMLSATPVNNRFIDLKNQLKLAYEGDSRQIDDRLNLNSGRGIDDIFKSAQRAFNAWSKLPPAERTTRNLLNGLDFDFFEVLDSVTIARSRKHIEKYYGTDEVGSFPKRLKPISLLPSLTDIPDHKGYSAIYDALLSLNLLYYTPSAYILPSRKQKYEKLYNGRKGSSNLTQVNRENGIRRLMAINLMKRMESSVSSFRITLDKILAQMQDTIKAIDDFRAGKVSADTEVRERFDRDDLDINDQDIDDDPSMIGRKVKISLRDMDYISWKRDLESDVSVLQSIGSDIWDITPEHDEKLVKLRRLIESKIEHPINGTNRKVIVFTAFADTAEYLYENLSQEFRKNFGIESAIITGTREPRTTIPGLHCSFNDILTYFSPVSKERGLLSSGEKLDIDLLIATDCISEGQNLQDCDFLVNYDIHWNPVRIIQRFGRIDRIGSRNERIQLVNFWPDLTLDSYIDLKGRVESRMKIVNMAAGGVGEDNVIEQDEREQAQDLEYRKKQLQRLQEDVVDIEDMQEGVSIMDLGLNDFRQDIMEYLKHNPKVENAPFGLQAVARSGEECPPGVIFILKNLRNSVNIDQQNRLHPFYLVYVANDGNVVVNHLQPKVLLDRMRHICRGVDKPVDALCDEFNKETDNGRNMEKYSALLGDAIKSIIAVKEESDMEAFLSGSTRGFFSNEIRGLDDFELICFLVVK